MSNEEVEAAFGAWFVQRHGTGATCHHGDLFAEHEKIGFLGGYDAGAAAERARAAELAQALDGCPHCDYDEAEGGLVNHCDACCRKVTTLAWAWLKEQERGA